MILLPRNSPRRTSIVTLSAKRVRKVASSRAVSPPPTTATSRPRKKNPSQVAHAHTPRPRNSSSDSSPSHRADAPVATMTVSARYSSLPTQMPNGRDEKSTRVASRSRMVGAESLRLVAELLHQLRTLDALREARVVLDVGGDHQLPHRHVARDHERLKVGSGGIDGGCEAGRPGADDRDLPAGGIGTFVAHGVGRSRTRGTVAVISESVYRRVVAPACRRVAVSARDTEDGLPRDRGAHRRWPSACVGC